MKALKFITALMWIMAAIFMALAHSPVWFSLFFALAGLTLFIAMVS